jgi:hypothetical protein
MYFICLIYTKCDVSCLSVCLSVCLYVCLYVCMSACSVVHNAFIQFSSYLNEISRGRSHVLNRCFCGEANTNFKWLATTGDNLPSTHEMMTSLKYAYGRLSQNSIDCPALHVQSSSSTNQMCARGRHGLFKSMYS